MFFQQADGVRGYWKCVVGGLGVCAETEGSTQDWSGHLLTDGERGPQRARAECESKLSEIEAHRRCWLGWNVLAHLPPVL